MITCSVCNSSKKKVILTKCCHLFCKECVEKLIQLRQRFCPHCKTRFGLEDYKEIYFN